MALPFMPFYWGDYWRDTAHLSDAEHVSYLRLISHYWQHGSLPVLDARLARIAGRTESEWAEMREIIRGFFSEGWHHARIERDLYRQKEVNEANSERAKRAANARWNAPSITQASVEQSLNNANQNQNQNHNHIQTHILEPEPEKIIGLSKSSRGTRLPQDWSPSLEDLNFARQEQVDVSREIERFKNYWIAKPKDNTKLDWSRTWRNWVMKADKARQTKLDKLTDWVNSGETGNVIEIGEASGSNNYLGLSYAKRGD